MNNDNEVIIEWGKIIDTPAPNDINGWPEPYRSNAHFVMSRGLEIAAKQHGAHEIVERIASCRPRDDGRYHLYFKVTVKRALDSASSASC